MRSIEPRHINATAQDLQGNGPFGRYLFLTGSDERAKQLSEHFNQLIVKPHPRQHNLYLGQLPSLNGNIDVAAISTGIGGPSADIIINELIALGARRLLRIGTAGSLQPEQIKVGDLVIATAAVRDDKASWDYIYPEYPAVASFDYLTSAGRAIKFLPQVHTHFGIVHSKSSLYAREFGYSVITENENYVKSLRLSGVMATEMECAQLFILTSLMNATLKRNNLAGPAILSGCILAIVGDVTAFSDEQERVTSTINSAVELGLHTTKELFLIDQQIKTVFD